MAAMTLLVASAVGAQVPTASPPQSKPSGGVAQGIKVHGHWVLEIRNPDGSFASRHEFNNALIPGMGTQLLAGLLGNHYVDTRWGINLWGYQDPCNPTNTNGPCAIGGSDLIVSLPMSSNVPAGTLELSGSVTIARNTTLYNVNTVWSATVRGTSQQAFNQFSEKAISVQALQGQIVQIKVVFSFS